MTSSELRQKFLVFFENQGHTIVKSSSLLPTDPSVLFTTAGMQQFKEYFLDKKSPWGDRVASCQKCFRTSDIEEVGDDRHLTFLEMIGNFSFGNYYKREAIEWALEFLVKECKLNLKNLWFTFFKGDAEVPEDKESKEIWQELGIPKEKIHGSERSDNFWGPTGEEGPCGPTTEIHYDLIQKPCQKGAFCLPNCQCGRFLEIWNLVFNEYYQDKNKKLSFLKQKGVDTGMGLERLTMIIQKKDSVFKTDLFEPIIRDLRLKINTLGNKLPHPKRRGILSDKFFQRITSPLQAVGYSRRRNKKLIERSERIIVDHIKGAVFLISEGILPSNVERGYVLRRILRRAIRYGKLLNLPPNFLIPLAQKVIEIYQEIYPEVKSEETEILTILQNEEEKFEKTLTQGLKQFEKLSLKGKIEGEEAFHLFDTYGFPLELTQELAKEKNIILDIKGFENAFEKHREISRAGAEKKFGGIGKEATYEATKLHTATHLLHQALRRILGEHIKQMGSDITPQRLRFDFSHSQKLTTEEIKKLEDLVNQKIKEDLEVKKTEMPLREALNSGALSFFREKYPEQVTVYTIGSFSKEICAGPHVKRTSELGLFKIIKEESSGAGVRRIRAILLSPNLKNFEINKKYEPRE